MQQHFFLKKSKGETRHVVRPAAQSVFSKKLLKTYFQPLLTLDVSTIDPQWQGVCLHFIATDISQETFEFKIDDQNLYELVRMDGHPVDYKSKDFYDLLDPFEDEEEQFVDLKKITNAELIPADPFNVSKNQPIRLTLGEPEWLQSPVDYSSEGFRFIGQLDSYYLFGRLYLYYNHDQKSVMQVIQCT